MNAEEAHTVYRWEDVTEKRVESVDYEGNAMEAMDAMVRNGSTWVPVVSGKKYIGCATLRCVETQYKKIVKGTDMGEKRAA